MNKEITEEKILSMLSGAVQNLEVEVWHKIENSKQSGLEDINSSHIELPKRTKTFFLKRIASIAIVVIFMIIGINAFKNIIYKFFDPPMNSSPSLAIVENDNQLFFQNFKDERKLYSMDLDGSNINKLSDNRISDFTVRNNSIYYIDIDNEKIIVINTDGTNKKVLENTNACFNIGVYKDWVFYTSFDGIYRIKKDGSELEKISDIFVHTLNVYNGNVYFSPIYREFEGLYKSDLDGKNTIQIYDRSVTDFLIYENNIFFHHFQSDSLYKIATDGSNLEKLKSDSKDISTLAFDIYKGELYFIDESWQNTSYLYKMNLDTNNLTKLTRIYATTIKVFEKNIYLFHPSYGGRLYKLNISGNNLEEILIKKGISSLAKHFFVLIISIFFIIIFLFFAIRIHY